MSNAFRKARYVTKLTVHGRFIFIGFLKSRALTYDNGKLKEIISITDDEFEVNVSFKTFVMNSRSQLFLSTCAVKISDYCCGSDINVFEMEDTKLSFFPSLRG